MSFTPTLRYTVPGWEDDSRPSALTDTVAPVSAGWAVTTVETTLKWTLAVYDVVSASKGPMSIPDSSRLLSLDPLASTLATPVAVASKAAATTTTANIVRMDALIRHLLLRFGSHPVRRGNRAGARSTPAGAVGAGYEPHVPVRCGDL